MKFLYSLLIIFLLYKYTNETACTSKIPSEVKDCTAIKLEGDEKCCFTNYTGTEDIILPYNEVKCIGLTEDQYKEIKNFLDEQIKQRNDKGIAVQTAKIQCDGNYLFISMLSLILFLL